MPYFDHNATTPLSPVARETWLRACDEHWHNPSSLYRDAAKARIRLDGAREQLAEFLGIDAARVVFTSGATEAAHAILGYLAGRSSSDPVLLNPTEHPAMLAAAERRFAGRVRTLSVTPDGVVTREALQSALACGRPAAVVVMAANNETGVLQPWADLHAVCRQAGVPLVCDASQWFGKLPASGLGKVECVIGSAHKFGGPKGVGFLTLPADADGFCVQPGGGQENGHRGGTENLPGIWAMVAALASAEQKKVFLESERLFHRQAFERALLARLPGGRVVASASERLWNTVAWLAPAGENHRWVTKLDKLGFQVSTGSACASGKEGPSHVLGAMGYSAAEAKRVLRFSSSWDTAADAWSALVDALATIAPSFENAPAGVVSVP